MQRRGFARRLERTIGINHDAAQFWLAVPFWLIVSFRQACLKDTAYRATARAIVQAVTDRWLIEEFLHHIKKVCCAGERQVRSVWSNLGRWNLKESLLARVELAT